ncbi:MAG: phenylalanine--tRNA ligase subunit beta, partial [Tannerella sp.]|nr:phenylalanine--tRNA ligase subunit beta [Tannerella sp.]
PNQALWALQCAALLIKEVAGGEICGPVQDIYPQPVASYPVELSFAKIDALVGKQIPRDVIRDILGSLEITIVGETAEGLSLQVPPYRYDVRRDVDVIEDILRVYGYNNVEVSENLRANLTEKTAVDQSYKLQEIISEQLCGEGFQEIWNNSLSKQAYYEHSQTWPVAQCVRVLNALSTDLCVMRQTLLFGGLESIGHNEKRKNPNLRFFEFGNCYNYKAEKKKEGQILSGYGEEFHLGLWLSGKYVENNWAHPDEAASPFQLKAALENIFRRLGISAKALSYQPFTSEVYAQGMEILTAGGKRIATWGVLQGALLKAADVDTDVFYAELSWKQLMKEAGKNQVNFSPLGKFQPVKRDMALLVDRSLAFADIEKTARDSERKFLKDIVLFDVYEGKNLPEGKKSYAVSFYLLNEEKPFTDKQIDSIMKKIQSNLEQKLGAQQR